MADLFAAIPSLRGTLSARAQLVDPSAPRDFLSSAAPALDLTEFAGKALQLQTAQEHFAAFVALCQEGAILQQVLHLSSTRNFLQQGLGALLGTVSIRNSMVDILYGRDLVRSLAFVPWLGMVIDQLTYVSNPGVAKQLAAAQDGAFDLRGVVANADEYSQLSGALKTGLATFAIEGDWVLSKGARIRILANGTPVRPQILDIEGSVLTIEGRQYFNGLPGDRKRYPTIAVPEGSVISLEVENAAGQVLMVMPTINSVPLQLDCLRFSVPGFQGSSLPLVGLEPHASYLAVGASTRFKSLVCNSLKLTQKHSFPSDLSWLSDLSDYSGAEMLLPLVGLAFARSLPADQQALMRRTDLSAAELAFLEVVLQASKTEFIRSIFRMLSQGHNRSWGCDLVVKQPEIVSGASSDSLRNPMLGTLGLAVVEVMPPKRETISLGSSGLQDESFMRGAVRGMGGAGLAHVGGGSGYSAGRLEFDWEHRNGVHRFLGYLPINLVSLRTN